MILAEKSSYFGRRSSLVSCLRSDGFTFIEMMLVVLIIAIMAAMAMPLLSSTITSQLKSAAQVVAADLNFAQIQSISHGDDPRVVVFDIPNNRYWIAKQSDVNTAITHPVSKQPYIVTFGQDSVSHLSSVSLTSVDVGNDDQLKFEMYGQLDQTTEARITLSCEGKTVAVSVQPLTGETDIGDIH